MWMAHGADRNYRADHNIYWNSSGGPVTFLDDLTFGEWQDSGFDQHSLVADPEFVNPHESNFHLTPESPALKLGFKPIDISEAGLCGPAEWVDAAKRIRRPPTMIPPRFQPPPELIDDGFETFPVGMQADLAKTYGEASGASIRVTDELAASGKHSLKFVDSPGLTEAWQPHLFYAPHLRDGIARLGFDLRFSSGAIVIHEWRDASQDYRVGPSMEIDARGCLTASGQRAGALSADEWIRFEIECRLGKHATGTYDLTLTMQGQKPKRLKGLRCDPMFKTLEWLGFISNATERSTFYLDNIKLELKGP